MKIEIYYCGEWNYLPEASRLEEELKGKFTDMKIELNKGAGGIFKVILNGRVIFDKADVLRFPNNNEISELI